MNNKYKFFFSCLLLAISTSAMSEGLALPSSDLVAPEVQDEEVTAPVDPNKNFTINVTAKDDVAVKAVTLYYRASGSNDYSRKAFIFVKGDKYQAELTPKELTSTKIEYYIKVEDTSGNTLLYGQSFSPLILSTTKEDKSAPLASAASASGANPGASKGINLLSNNAGSNTATPTNNNSIWKNKWLWIGVGVAAAAVAASSGGGSDSSPSASPKPTVTITGPTVPGQ